MLHLQTSLVRFSILAINVALLYKLVRSLPFQSIVFWKKGQPQPLFRLFSVFWNKQYTFTTIQCEKNVMPIQYMAPGFKPTTSQTWVVSHNHYTWAPTLSAHCFQPNVTRKRWEKEAVNDLFCPFDCTNDSVISQSCQSYNVGGNSVIGTNLFVIQNKAKN